MELLEYILLSSKLAFLIGYKQKQKRRLTIQQLKEEVGFIERNAYFETIWSAYKSGLYAKRIKD